jgi:hypothetical protein
MALLREAHYFFLEIDDLLGIPVDTSELLFLFVELPFELSVPVSLESEHLVQIAFSFQFFLLDQSA